MRRDNVLKLATAFGLLFCFLDDGFPQSVSKDPPAPPAPAIPAVKQEVSIEPSALTSLQDAINRIAGALEANNNQRRSVEEADQSRRELAAQESMALWAFWMFVAAAASAVLTLVGLLLIWRTVVYTKAAAASAEGAVHEARKGTAAAEAAVAETRRIGEAQVRAYLSCYGMRTSVDDLDGDLPPDFLQFQIFLKNTGLSPALRLRCRGDVIFHPPNAGDIPYEHAPDFANCDPMTMNAGGEGAASNRNIAVTDILTQLRSGNRLIVVCYYDFFDVFDQRHSGIIALQAFPHNNFEQLMALPRREIRGVELFQMRFIS